MCQSVYPASFAQVSDNLRHEPFESSQKSRLNSFELAPKGTSVADLRGLQ